MPTQIALTETQVVAKYFGDLTPGELKWLSAEEKARLATMAASEFDLHPIGSNGATVYVPN